MTGRLVDSQRPAVLTICRIAGGELANVIPDEAVVEGTIRSLSPDSDAVLEDGFRRTVAAVGAMRGIETEIEYRLSYPVTENAPEPTELAREVIRAGSGRYVELAESSMGAEDFAYYLKRCPGSTSRSARGRIRRRSTIPGLISLTKRSPSESSTS